MPCETVLIQSSWDGILPTLQLQRFRLNLMAVTLAHVGYVTSVNNSIARTVLGKDRVGANLVFARVANWVLHQIRNRYSNVR